LVHPPALPLRPEKTVRDEVTSRRGVSPISWVANRSIAELLTTWLAINLSFGVIYWLASFLPGHGLRELGQPLGHGAGDLMEAIYFSFVTGLSIGFGDVVPNGILRLFAVVEGAACLLVFGAIISKLVSGRQEELTEEIHRIAFEDRLGRVRTNLHLVVRELQEIGEMCRDRSDPPESVLTRIESAAAVFSGEMRAIHDLLYRPQMAPGEDVLESILAHLDGGLREFSALLSCLSAEQRGSAALTTNVRSMAGLAEEICGECVPREYAPHLKVWMDRVQSHARGMSGARA
jgi:potassium channel LctB